MFNCLTYDKVNYYNFDILSRLLLSTLIEKLALDLLNHLGGRLDKGLKRYTCYIPMHFLIMINICLGINILSVGCKKTEGEDKSLLIL